MKKYFGLIMLWSMSFVLVANTGKISGTITDNKTKEPLEFVNVSLFNASNNTLVTGITTDIDGNFLLDNIPFDNYQLRISFIGYQDFHKNFNITPQQTTFSAEKISLKEDSKILQEVEVVGMATQMKFEIDKKVFMVNQTALSAGAGTDEILRSIPSVNVDNEGNISLRNDENVQVWINGKPSGLTTDNRAQILEQLPAESVERVEIITNPSAKYNPEGSSGIINIVLKKNRKAGYYGSVSAGLSYPWGLNLGGNINYSHKKFDTYLNLSYRKSERESGGYTDRTQFARNELTGNADTTYLNQDNEGTNSWEGMFARAGVDYHINDKNTIGISGYGMLGKSNSETDYNYFFLNNNHVVTNQYSQNSLYNRDYYGYNATLDYKHEFNKSGHELTASANYSAFTNESVSDYTQNRGGNLSLRQENSDRISDYFSLQADYILPVQEKGKVEAGYRSTFSIDDSYVDQSTAGASYYTDDFDFERQIHSGYAIYKNMFRSIGYQVGLRGEQTVTNWTNLTGKGHSSHFDLFPSLFLSKIFNEKNELQLSATRRINRPGGWHLNPFVNTSDSTSISFGNPDLKPEYSWAYEMNYITTFGKHTLSSSVYFRHANNVIQRVSEMVDDKYMQSTYRNITNRQNAGFELTLKNRFFKIVELTSMFNAYYSKLDGNEEFNVKESESFSWNAKIIGNIMIAKGFSAQIMGDYSAPSIIAQGKRMESYSIDLGLRKTFYDKFNVNLSVRDILDSRKYRSETSADNFYQKSERYRQGSNVSLTLSYNFGNMKPKFNKKQRQPEGAGMGEEEM